MYKYGIFSEQGVKKKKKKKNLIFKKKKQTKKFNFKKKNLQKQKLLKELPKLPKTIKEKFKQYNDFKRRTFERACKEINNNYELNLRYEEIKEGRKVVALKFIFKKTRVHKVTNPKTGVEQNLYEKPELQTKKRSNKNKRGQTAILKGQLPLRKKLQQTLCKILDP